MSPLIYGVADENNSFVGVPDCNLVRSMPWSMVYNQVQVVTIESQVLAVVSPVADSIFGRLYVQKAA
jgi:hypothetical protein